MKTKNPVVTADVAKLAEQLVRVLASQRPLGASAYPTTLGRLIEFIDAQVTLPTLKAAVNKGIFKGQAVLALGPGKAAFDKHYAKVPVALLDDIDKLADHPLLLEFALRTKRTEKIRGFSVAKLSDLLSTKLQNPFKDAVKKRLQAKSLPPAVGAITIIAETLFLYEDVLVPQPLPNRSSERSVAQVDQKIPDFATVFTEVFARLDQQRRGSNMVSLVDLRREIWRKEFDSGIQSLRQAGQFVLLPAEGQDGLQAGEREAGMVEDGKLLLYAMKSGR